MKHILLLALFTFLAGCSSAPAHVTPPVPGDLAVAELDLKALQNAALFQEHGHTLDDVAEFLRSDWIVDVTRERCGIDPVETIHTLLVAAPLTGNPREGLAVIEGTFDAQELLDCMRAPMQELRLGYEPITRVGLSGYDILLPNGIELSALALSRHQILLVLSGSLPATEAVLRGDAPSLLDSKLYASAHSNLPSDTLVTALVAEFPAQLRAQLPDIVSDLQTGFLTLTARDTGLDLALRVELGSAQSASTAASGIPLALFFLGSELGPLGEVLSQSLQIRTEDAFLILELPLEEATLRQLAASF